MPHCESFSSPLLSSLKANWRCDRKERVDNLKEKMKLIQREENEEDAKRFSELVLAEMEELVTKEAQVSCG